MIIHLNEIPEDGKDFILTRATGELNKILEEFVGSEDYKIEFYIRPLSHGYELIGSTQGQTPELCSRCGLDIVIPLNTKFKELMLPMFGIERNSKYSRQNHVTDSEHLSDIPSVIEYDGNVFNIGEYLHEVIGLLIPSCPVAPIDGSGKCKTCGVDTTQENAFSYTEKMPEEKVTSPFAALKRVKLNS
jgi:uncharacterized metal-binding protein YceD (DUF177 family)